MALETDEFKRRRAFARQVMISMMAHLSSKPEWIDFLFTGRKPSDDSPLPGSANITRFEYFSDIVHSQMKSFYAVCDGLAVQPS